MLLCQERSKDIHKDIFKNITTKAANIPIGTANVMAAFCSTFEIIANVVAKVVAVTGSAAITPPILTFPKKIASKEAPLRPLFSCRPLKFL